MRRLTDVEIEARIATRLAATTARIQRLEVAVCALIVAVELLSEDAHPNQVANTLAEARTTLAPPR